MYHKMESTTKLNKYDLIERGKARVAQFRPFYKIKVFIFCIRICKSKVVFY